MLDKNKNGRMKYRREEGLPYVTTQFLSIEVIRFQLDIGSDTSHIFMNSIWCPGNTFGRRRELHSVLALLLKKKKSVKNSAFFRQDQYDMLFEKSNCSSFSPKSSSADNYIFKYKGNLNSYS